MIARTSLLAVLAAGMQYGQTITTGEVTGTITDLTSAAVTGATVVLTSVDAGGSRTVESDTSGIYRFTLLKPGTYEISSRSAGLKSDRGGLIVAVGQVMVLNLTLKLEEAKQIVLVTDGAPLLNTDNANATYTVTQRQLELLPLPGGDLSAIAFSMPAVVINNRYGNGNFAAQGVGSASNLFTINGTDTMDPYWNVNNSGTSGMLLGVNEIQEASIIQNAYEGQYGRQAGMQVNYVSKSGTNAYHGNLVYSYNGSFMNANDFFNNATGVRPPHAVSNQYAASLGGRIIRNKLYFFADTEGFRIALPGSASVVAIPSSDLQNYTLKTVRQSQVALYQKMFDLYNTAPGHDRAIPVTNGTGPLQDSTQRLGCGALAGTPTGTGGVFGANVPCTQAWGASVASQSSEWLLTARADYNISPKQSLFVRFKTDHGFLPFVTSAINPAFNIISVQPDYEGQLNHTYVISPRLVNNFIGSGSYNDYVSSFSDLPAALKLFPFRVNFFDGGANGSFGQITSMGAPAFYPQGRRAGQLQIVDDLSYTRGKHSLKAGVNYRYNREADLLYSAGAYVGRFTFFGLDEFASGTLNGSSGSNYFQLFPRTPVLHLRLYNLGLYAQDQWAVNKHLKITATLRLDRNGNPFCVDRCFVRLTSPFPELNKGVSIPYDQSIQTGLEHAFYNSEPVVPQPRVSAVYSPGWSRSTVIRGGIGEFSDLYPMSFAGKMAGNAPNVFFAQIRTGRVDTSGSDSAPAIASASANAFQSQFAKGATLAQLQQAVAPAAFAAPSYYSLPSTVRTPKVLEWSLEIQQQVGARNVLTARYAGNHGHDLFLVNPGVNASANPALYPKGFAGLPATAPDARFQVVSQLTNNGYSNYDGLTIMFRRALGRGFQSQISYTWGHALDTLSNGGLTNFSYDSLAGQINPKDIRALNYGNADYDVRHHLSGDFTWDFPFQFKNQWIRNILAGWSVAGKISAHTGTPFSASNGRIASQLTSFGGTVLGDVVDSDIRTACGSSAVDLPCFTASQFASIAAQTDFGNRPRNFFRAPGYVNLDSSVYKTVPLGERMQFTLGASAFNLLNHANFADPNSNLSGSGVGLITFTTPNPSGPYGLWAGPSGRAIVVTGRLSF